MRKTNSDYRIYKPNYLQVKEIDREHKNFKENYWLMDKDYKSQNQDYLLANVKDRDCTNYKLDYLEVREINKDYCNYKRSYQQAKEID